MKVQISERKNLRIGDGSRRIGKISTGEKMMKRGVLIRNGIPGGKLTNSLIYIPIHVGNIWALIMKQAQL